MGDNDVSGGKPLETARQELHDVLLYLLDQHCRVHLCTVCSRADTDVRSLNELIQKICESTGANQVACYNSFIYGNGRPVLHYYNRDRIHLSAHGAKTWVSFLNSYIPIIKKSVSRNDRGATWNQTARR